MFFVGKPEINKLLHSFYNTSNYYSFAGLEKGHIRKISPNYNFFFKVSEEIDVENSFVSFRFVSFSG